MNSLLVLYYLLLFTLGSVVGSFLNVVIDRLPVGRSLWGRSHADCCGRALTVADLIPIVSFLFSRGRCRYCKQPISFYYPLVELITAILTVVAFVHFTFPTSLFYLINFYFLIVYFFMDLKYGLVSVAIIIINLILILAWFLASYLFPVFCLSVVNCQWSDVVAAVIAAGAAALFFLLLIIVTHGHGMGQGDVLMVFVFSLMIGFPNSIIMVFLSFVIGGLFAGSLVLFGRKKFGQTVPFGPFLVLGTFINFFWGQTLLDLYFGYL